MKFDANKIELHPAPAGYEYTGEHRRAKEGESYIDSAGRMGKALKDHKSSKNWILRRKRWRANIGAKYYAVNTDMAVVRIAETCSVSDQKRFSAGNYFQHQEQAEVLLHIIKNQVIAYNETIGNKMH